MRGGGGGGAARDPLKELREGILGGGVGGDKVLAGGGGICDTSGAAGGFGEVE